ncbi:MAG: MEDS domain-containing protein [Ilumatobacteraceae bacterium]
MALVTLGIDGLEVEAGEHLCGLYSGARERDALILPFLRAGLRAGDKCICVVDGAEPAELVTTLSADVAASGHSTGNQLDVIRSSDIYLRAGVFSAVEVLASWKAAISEVMYDTRFDLVRAVETWSLREVVPDRNELLVLESEMNRFLPLFPQVILCLYDLERFGGGIVVDLLKTHPRVLVGGAIVENPYCMTPDEVHVASEAGTLDAIDRDLKEVAQWCYDATTGSS